MHSGVRALRRRRVKGHFSQKVYSLDFERETGKWRMKDNWQVEVSSDPLYSFHRGLNADRATSACSASKRFGFSTCWIIEIIEIDWRTSFDFDSRLASRDSNQQGMLASQLGEERAGRERWKLGMCTNRLGRGSRRKRGMNRI